MDTSTEMTAENEGREAQIDEIHILIFSVMEIRFGVDMEQIREGVDPEYIDDDGINIIPFHEKFPFPGRQVTYQVPRILCLKDEVRIMVDEVEEVRTLPIDCIRPLPDFLEKCREPNAIWGAALVGDEIILLLDFLR